MRTDLSRKQILVIFTGPLELGGIERSLLGLIESFDFKKYDVDLFLFGHHGTLFSHIDKRVHLLPEVKELAYLRDSFLTKLKHGCFFSAALRCRDRMLSRFRKTDNDATWADVVQRCVKKQSKHYDLAISFFRPFDYLIEKVDADIKVGWIHTDYSNKDTFTEGLEKDYSRLDVISAVSKECKESFCRMFPKLADKVVVIENIHSRASIQQSAVVFTVNEEMPEDGSIRLLSIGRFCTAKNFDNVPDICKKILKAGINVKWYLIGFGPDESLIRQKIEENGMQERVMILGKKDNPYPYIRACDLYVQPSRYEGKCVSVVEAQILQKPVVITAYKTSASQLLDGVDGVIVPQDNEGCAQGIIELLKNPERMTALVENCKNRDYSNRAEVEKLYRLIEEQ